jgi:hypothetical protein
MSTTRKLMSQFSKLVLVKIVIKAYVHKEVLVGYYLNNILEVETKLGIYLII